MLASSDDLAQGVAFGTYVVHERIGRGGMATVYRAEHRLLEKPVALKVMDRTLLETPVGLQRFLLEGRAAASIKHPNVVDITDVGVHDGVPYLVMELLAGEDLDTHLRKQRLLDSGAAVRVALPVVAALHAAHGSGVVHRDIKPSNIFLAVGPDDQVVPKVLDFGISKMSFDRATIERMPTPRNQIIGTPQYLPPEALRGPGAMGPLSDQYSLGVVLYQCVTGRTPFAGDTLLALLESLARGTFDPPRAVQPSVSAGLERVILRALSPEPSDRFPTIRDMGRALLELGAERTQTVWGQAFATPARARVPTPVRDELPSARSALQSGERLAAEPFRARPWRHIAIGAGLVLAGALAATLLWRAGVPTRAAGPGLLAPPEAAHEPAIAAPAPPVAAAPTTRAAPPLRSEPAARVLGLMPSATRDATPLARAEVATSARPNAAATPSKPNDRGARVRRALAAKARAKGAKARSPKKAAKASAASSTSPAAPAEAPPLPEATAIPATPEPERSPPPTPPILGANGAPLLD
jgi:tRNA A-37 threonylcarbamoyl transferase component Bud32